MSVLGGSLIGVVLIAISIAIALRRKPTKEDDGFVVVYPEKLFISGNYIVQYSPTLCPDKDKPWGIWEIKGFANGTGPEEQWASSFEEAKKITESLNLQSVLGLNQARPSSYTA